MLSGHDEHRRRVSSPSAAALAAERRLSAEIRARSTAPAVGSTSRATWSLRCMRRVSATTARAARSSVRRRLRNRAGDRRPARPRARAHAASRARGAARARDPRARRRQRRARGAAARCARALGERASRIEFSSRARTCGTAARALARFGGARDLARSLAGAAVRGSDRRERGARRAAGDVLRETRRRVCCRSACATPAGASRGPKGRSDRP